MLGSHLLAFSLPPPYLKHLRISFKSTQKKRKKKKRPRFGETQTDYTIQMEAAMELEDDVFFKDLSKQISLLIMDDDDEDSLSHCPSLNLQAFAQAIHPSSTQASFFSYDHQQTIKRESKGTGVFIPRSTPNPRRMNAKQPARSMAKFQRPCDHNSRTLAQNNNIMHPSYDHSFSFRRF